MTDTSQGPTFNTGKEGKPKRPWFKKKRIFLPLGLVLLFIVASAAGGGKETDTASTPGTSATTEVTGKTTTTALPKLYPGRVDSQPKDREATIGQAVEFSGYTTSNAA